jgi:hypothetical protein
MNIGVIILIIVVGVAFFVDNRYGEPAGHGQIDADK